MFLSNKKNTTSKEDVLVFNHSLNTMDNGDFVSKLSDVINRMQRPEANIEVLNKELNDLLDSNSNSNKIGSKTIELTRKQVENTIRAILNLPIDYNGESDDSIIVSQGENYDIVNELSKYIMFPRGMKVQGGKHIIINQPKKVTITITPATETTPEVTAETSVENLVDVFNGITVNKETLTEEDIQNLTNKALAQLLIADGAKFVVNYNDITIAPGESSAQKKAKKLTLKRLLSDGILYSDQKTVRRPSKRVTNMSPNGFTLNYDLAMHTPEALKENVKAKLAEMNQQVVSTEPVSVNDSNFEEDNSTVTVDNKEISTSNEVVRTENTPTVVEVITSESKENSLAIVEDLKKNSEVVPKIKNESHYTNIETNEQLDRVTSVIKDTEVNFDDNVDDALRHGNEMDNFIRDYFNDNLKELTEYPFVEKENVLLLENFVKQLDILRD